MSVTTDLFGNFNGTDVYKYTLENDNQFKVSVISYGGRITEIIAPDANNQFANVVKGFTDLDGYVKDDSYLGALCGRTSGRIGNGTFTLDGNTYTLSRNNGKKNHLHGGVTGYSDVVWQEAEHGADDKKSYVTLSHVSPDGDEGYPGELTIDVTYALDAKTNALTISYKATTTKPTIVDLTNHSYFNLSGDFTQTILDHHLQIESDMTCQLADDLIPTGDFIDFDDAEHPFDFRDGKYIKETFATVPSGVDHPFLLTEGARNQVILTHPDSGRSLVIDTQAPAVVVYTGNMIPAPLQNTAICLETQSIPDSINHDNFNDVTLYPEDTYQTKTTYTFDV